VDWKKGLKTVTEADGWPKRVAKTLHTNISTFNNITSMSGKDINPNSIQQLPTLEKYGFHDTIKLNLHLMDSRSQSASPGERQQSHQA
jgi:hypothetical protein